MKKSCVFIACLLPTLSFGCSITLGLAHEEHHSQVTKYFPSRKLIKTINQNATKQFKQLSGCDLIWKRYQNMDALKSALIHGQVDIGWLKLFNLYLAHRQNPNVRPFLTELSVDADTHQLSPYYNSYILTKTGRGGVTQLADITIHNIAFLHPHSASGFIYPIMYLIKRHIVTVAQARQPIFINNYDILYRKLLKPSNIKAVATWDNVLLRDGHRSQLKRLTTLHQLPNPAFVESHPLPKPILSALTITLTSLGKAIAISPLSAKQGLTPSTNVNYHSAYQLFNHYCQLLPSYCGSNPTETS